MLPTPGSSHFSSYTFASSHLFFGKKPFQYHQNGEGWSEERRGGAELKKSTKTKQRQSCVLQSRHTGLEDFMMATHMGKVSRCLHSPLDFSSIPSGFLSFPAKRNVFLSFFEIILILF